MKRNDAIALGGVFLQSDQPATLADWYQRHLGLGFAEHGGVHFCSPPAIGAVAAGGYPVFSLFPRRSEYFKGSPLMLNFVVADLAATLNRLRAEGVPVESDREEGPYGTFGWLTDPDGNRIELWQPPAVAG